MTKRKLQKLIYHSKNNQKELTAREAAQALGLSERQIFRVKKGLVNKVSFL
ncbi:hypothetical protein [Thermoanaerobacter mathranii]|uniref:hypothetical protein n=1 Tax=Thermoanaerobacter mathranii TaxID=583357 RepID=UPI003D6B36B6